MSILKKIQNLELLERAKEDQKKAQIKKNNAECWEKFWKELDEIFDEDADEIKAAMSPPNEIVVNGEISKIEFLIDLVEKGISPVKIEVYPRGTGIRHAVRAAMWDRECCWIENWDQFVKVMSSSKDTFGAFLENEKKLRQEELAQKVRKALNGRGSIHHTQSYNEARDRYEEIFQIDPVTASEIWGRYLDERTTFITSISFDFWMKGGNVDIFLFDLTMIDGEVGNEWTEKYKLWWAAEVEKAERARSAYEEWRAAWLDWATAWHSKTWEPWSAVSVTIAPAGDNPDDYTDSIITYTNSSRSIEDVRSEAMGGFVSEIYYGSINHVAIARFVKAEMVQSFSEHEWSHSLAYHKTHVGPDGLFLNVPWWAKDAPAEMPKCPDLASKVDDESCTF